MFFKSNNKKKIRITHTFDKDVYEKFTELCEKNMTPRSTVLNENVRYMTKIIKHFLRTYTYNLSS